MLKLQRVGISLEICHCDELDFIQIRNTAMMLKQLWVSNTNSVCVCVRPTQCISFHVQPDVIPIFLPRPHKHR